MKMTWRIWRSGEACSVPCIHAGFPELNKENMDGRKRTMANYWCVIWLRTAIDALCDSPFVSRFSSPAWQQWMPIQKMTDEEYERYLKRKQDEQQRRSDNTESVIASVGGFVA